MKYVFTPLLVAGSLCSVACAAPYVLPANQPGALTPYDIQPVYALEALYGKAAHSDEPDVWGPRLRFNLYSDAASELRQQFSLNVAALWGSESSHAAEGSCSTDLFLLPLTVGYDINIALSDRMLFFVGGKAGYAWADADTTCRDSHVRRSRSGSSGGFTWSAGAGFKYMPNDTLYLSLGYEYAGTDMHVGHHSSGSLRQHIISLGVGCQF